MVIGSHEVPTHSKMSSSKQRLAELGFYVSHSFIEYKHLISMLKMDDFNQKEEENVSQKNMAKQRRRNTTNKLSFGRGSN